MSRGGEAPVPWAAGRGQLAQVEARSAGTRGARQGDEAGARPAAPSERVAAGREAAGGPL
ncbi:hypothetical protein [Acidithiobacillus sp.]